GVHNVQVRTPRGRENLLADLENRADLVLIDAPCTGIGTWRRNPDAKWRGRPRAPAQRLEGQTDPPHRAAALAQPRGPTPHPPPPLFAGERAIRSAHFSRASRILRSYRLTLRARSASARTFSAVPC